MLARRSRPRPRVATVAGISLLAPVLLLAIAGPWLASLLGHDAYTSDLVAGARPEGGPVGPGSAFWLGADRLFRDELARLALGARFSLGLAAASTTLAIGIGSVVGLVAGWAEGSWADRVLMAIADVGLSFPFLLLVMAVGVVIERTTPLSVLLVLGLTGWLGVARVVRARTIAVRRSDYVLAALALGQAPARVLVRHVAPHLGGPIVVLASQAMGQMLLAETSLGYLGAGLPPPTPTWGRRLLEAQDAIATAPWLLASPGVAVVSAVLAFNLVGEGMRDALDR
jgi:ABC-type dipeptide/oligopeptide/nickel transport system permease subunit